MAENNNKGYSTGGSDAFDLFSAFDSAPSVKQDIPAEPAVKNDEPMPQPVAQENAAEDKKETNYENAEKKSPLFAVLCAVLCIAIIACGCLSFSNIAKYSKASVSIPQASESDAGFNVFSTMVAKYNPAQYPAGIQQSLVKAFAANNDLVGWLYIPNTAVNTPVVQAKDNTYYLRNNFFGQNTKYGMAYADYRCTKSVPSTNQVIYGHNMPSGTHFYDVSRYEDIEWYKKHPVIKYSTLTNEYTYLVYAAFYTTAQTKYNGGYFFNYIYPNMGSQSISGYIQQINERAIYRTGVAASSNDRFITLSTCTHSLDSACGTDIDGRLVVVGRLLRMGESENVDTSRAISNPNYRRPQIWYDHNKKTNPYRTVKWIPSEK